MKKLVVVALLLLCGCATGVNRDHQKNIQKVAILSFAGHSYHAMENVPPTGPALEAALKKYNSAKSMWESTLSDKDFDISALMRWKQDVSDWKLDDFIVEKVGAALAPRYEIAAFEYDPGSYAEDGTFGNFSENHGQELADLIRAQPGFAAAQNIDAYIVVLPSLQEPTIWPRHNYGMGAVKSWYLDGPDDTVTVYYMVHAFTYVAVVDGRDLHLLAGEVTRDRDRYARRFRGMPGEEVDGGYWAPSFAAMTAAQQQKITDKLKQFLGESLPGTLQKLALLP